MPRACFAAALAGNDPVVFFESQRLYDMPETVYAEVPSEYYEIPIGEPSVVRTGDRTSRS